MRIIDFHSHILPNIDDGSKNLEMTEEMLRMASEQYIDVMVATPHFYADSMSIERFLKKRRKVFPVVKELAREYGIRLLYGAEVAFFAGMSRAEDIERLCIQKTNLMLVEMPFREWTAADLREIELLIRRGIQPIIAHLERFYAYQSDKGIIDKLLEMPVLVQINAECLLHWGGRRQALRLFRDGAAHLLGSDCHNLTTRAQNLEAGRKVLKKKLGEDILEEIDDLGKQLLRKKQE